MDYKKTPGKELKNYGRLVNKEKTIISIITPFYNSGGTIEETANSILNQTYPFFEWIIVDDGSKDKKSLKKLDEIAKKDKRIKVLHKENEGPSTARDYGIEKSSKDTKYIYFLDSDDLIDKTTLECLYWTLETNKNASFAYTSAVNFGTKEFLWQKYFTIEKEKEENLLTISAMIKKEDLLEVGCFGIKEKAMYEDWNLWLKLLKAGKIPVRVNSPLFWYRQTESGEFSRAKENHVKAMKYIKETAKDISNESIEPIQYPRYGEKYAMVEDYKYMILPDYKKDNRLTILFVFPWMVVGGADYFNLDLIKRLDPKQYRSIILTTTPSDNPIRQDFEDYAEIYDMSAFIDRINYINFADYIITSRKVDLVFISNSEYGYYMTPYLKSKYPTIPFIDYIHCIDINDKRKGFVRCSRDVTNYLSGTYVCNNATLREIKDDFGIEKAETIYIGTNEKKFDSSKFDKEKLKEKYGIPKDKIIITYLCRLSEQKRPDMFCEIGRRACLKDKSLFFVVAGDGPYMPYVRSHTDQNFKLLGMIKETEEIYALSDITLNCSSFEGLALTSYESLSMGVPVVSTDAGGQAELIDEKVGALIHYNENPTKEEYENEINQYVDQIIRVKNELDKLVPNCRKKIIEGFTLDLMAKKFDKIFKEAINHEKNRKIEQISTSTYEVALEAFYKLYFDYTNYFYEKNFDIYLPALLNGNKEVSSKYQKFKNKLKVYHAVDEGRDILELLRSIKRTIKEVIFLLKKIFKAIISFFKLIYKVSIYYIRRIFNKNRGI